MLELYIDIMHCGAHLVVKTMYALTIDMTYVWALKLAQNTCVQMNTRVLYSINQAKDDTNGKVEMK